MEQLDNLRTVKRFVEKSRKYAEDMDSAGAHMAEKAAWQTALQAIVNGDDRAVELAYAALETEDIMFVRKFV